jgi:hypothetical protein
MIPADQLVAALRKDSPKLRMLRGRRLVRSSLMPATVNNDRQRFPILIFVNDRYSCPCMLSS